MQYHYLILTLICLIKCDLEPFVVEGEIGNIRQFPHAAFLKVKCYSKDRPGWICGSSVVNQGIILTAAHCVDGCTGEKTMTVSVGHGHRAKGFMSSVLHFHAHEEYRRNFFAYDIALIRLKTDLKFSFNVRRVALMKLPPRFVKAQVAGWGNIKEYPKIKPQIFHYTDQYVWTLARCRKLDSDIPAGTFCGRSKKGNSYPTGGDSGSALVVRGYIQIGLVSYKMPSISRSLVVYTDTGYFFNWIKKNSKKLYCVMEEKANVQ